MEETKNGTSRVQRITRCLECPGILTGGSSKQLPEGLSGGEDVNKLQGDFQKSSPETEISSSECDAARDEIVSQSLGQPN